jgi:hypothetical protein
MSLEHPAPKNKNEFMSHLMKEKIASIEAVDQKHKEFIDNKTDTILSQEEKTANLGSGIRNFITASLLPAMAAGGFALSAGGIDYPGYELAAIGSLASLMFIGPISEGYKKSIEKIKTYFN